MNRIRTEIARKYQFIFHHFRVQSVAFWHTSACCSFFILLLILATVSVLLDLWKYILIKLHTDTEERKERREKVICRLVTEFESIYSFFPYPVFGDIIAEEDILLYVHIISMTSCILRWWPALWYFLVALSRREIFTRFTAFWIYPPFLQYPAENVSFIISFRRTFYVWYLKRAHSNPPLCTIEDISRHHSRLKKVWFTGLLSILSFEYLCIYINKRTSSFLSLLNDSHSKKYHHQSRLILLQNIDISY